MGAAEDLLRLMRSLIAKAAFTVLAAAAAIALAFLMDGLLMQYVGITSRSLCLEAAASRPRIRFPRLHAENHAGCGQCLLVYCPVRRRMVVEAKTAAG